MISKQKRMQNIAKTIVQDLVDRGFEAYYAGGWVRDKLLGLKSSDIDIATNARPDQVQKIFSRTVPVGEAFGVVLVVRSGVSFEVTTFRQDLAYKDGRHPEGVAFTTAEEDAKRRDFTINGLFYNPLTETVLDYVKGQGDLKKKTIRSIGKAAKRFEEDKLRMMRAVRFAARLHYTIEKQTYAAVKKMAGQLHQISMERIHDELIKMLCDPNRVTAVELLQETRLGEQIFPEWGEEKEMPLSIKKYLDALGLKASKELILAAFFWPLFQQKGSAAALKKRLKQLKFSNKELSLLVSYCSGQKALEGLDQQTEAQQKRVLRRETIADEIALLKVRVACGEASKKALAFCRKQLRAFKDENLFPKPLLSGQDLLDLGFQADKTFQTILRDVEDAQLEGRLKTSKAARNYVLKKYHE